MKGKTINWNNLWKTEVIAKTNSICCSCRLLCKVLHHRLYLCFPLDLWAVVNSSFFIMTVLCAFFMCFVFRTLARRVVWRRVWNCDKVSSPHIPKWRASSFWASVQLSSEKWHCDAGRVLNISILKIGWNSSTRLLDFESLSSRLSWMNCVPQSAICSTLLLKDLPSLTSSTLPCPPTCSLSTG